MRGRHPPGAKFRYTPLPSPACTCAYYSGEVPTIPGRTLSDRQLRDVGALLSLPSLEPLASHLRNNPEPWCKVLDENDAEKFLPTSGWTTDEVSIERQAFLSLAVVHALRPDRTMAAAAELVERVFGEGGGDGGDEEQGSLPWDDALDLEASVKEGARPDAPVLLCSEAGHDASWKVLRLPSWDQFVANVCSCDSVSCEHCMCASRGLGGEEGAKMLL